MMLLYGLGIILLSILAIALTYILLAIVSSRIPVNRHFSPPADGIQIGISSNGVHMDFIVPVVNPTFNWTSILDSKDYQTPLNEDTYLSFGWGDKGFYLDIDTWGEMTVKVAFNAVVIPSPTLMHITAYSTIHPPKAKRSKSLHISQAQYTQLCQYILQQFDLDEQGMPKHLPGEGYTPDDNFYHAKGSYHAFFTCNSWVNYGLKKIGVRTAFWSPLDRGVFYQLGKL